LFRIAIYGSAVLIRVAIFSVVTLRGVDVVDLTLGSDSRQRVAGRSVGGAINSRAVAGTVLLVRGLNLRKGCRDRVRARFVEVAERVLFMNEGECRVK
jgi:hypothetical protein